MITEADVIRMFAIQVVVAIVACVACLLFVAPAIALTVLVAQVGGLLAMTVGIVSLLMRRP